MYQITFLYLPTNRGPKSIIRTNESDQTRYTGLPLFYLYTEPKGLRVKKGYVIPQVLRLRLGQGTLTPPGIVDEHLRHLEGLQRGSKE